MKKESRIIRICAVAAALLATVLGFVKSVFISLDIDESYLVACAYRIAAGDRVFADMWEPHQLASLIPSLFVRAYMSVLGTAEGIVIFLRIVSVIIHICIGIAFYRFMNRRTEKGISFTLLLVHLNFLPKWVQSLDFELMAYWAVLGCCLLLVSVSQTSSEEKTTSGSSFKDCMKFFAAGFLLLISMLSYPTLIILYPLFIAGIIVCNGKKAGIGGTALFTLGALLPGLLVLFLIFRSVPSGEFVSSIFNVFSNPSHATQPFFKRIGEYAAEGGKSLLIWALITCGVYIPARMVHKGINDQEDTACFSMLVSFIILQSVMIIGCIFFDKNQFFMQGRYAAFIIPALIISLKGNDKKVLWFGLLPGIASVLSVIAVTNMNAGTAWSKSMPAVLASVYVLLKAYSNAEKDFMKKSAECAAIALIAGLVLCRLGLIRVTGCLPVTINADFEKVTHGPSRGIYITQAFAEAANREYEALEGLYDSDTPVLYVGAEMLLYLDHPCRIASPSVEGTTIYDEYFLTYYEKHPEHLPEVVIYDRNYTEVYEYRRYPREYVIDEWIADNYPRVLMETQDLTVYAK